jgi:hypothetical protein
VNCQGSTLLSAITDSSFSPSTAVSTFSTGAGINIIGQVTMMVLSGNYYQVSVGAGSASLNYWTEWY